MRTLLLVACLALLVGPARTAEWRETKWQGEPAWESRSAGWRAVVSAVRARLMHFGPDGSDVNLLLAPPTRANPNRLGGHRVWLGPQAEWSGGWPPPAAWEYREPVLIGVENETLRFVMPSTSDAWPQLTRTYRWDGATLVCGAEFTGGTRPAQIVQIFQVPATMLAEAAVHPEAEFPAGYVRLPSSAGPFAARFAPPAHASLRGDLLTLRHTGQVGKYGYRPQPLLGRLDGYEFTVSRGAQTGEVVGEPDEGFHTQVYLSGEHEAFGELEQLSPLFAAGKPARFEVRLSGRKP